MKITETLNGHGDAIRYNIEDIDVHKYSRRQLEALVKFLEVW